ncbi:PPOX class F420-dependent oxidoreductase [Kitasatospora sp. NPDC048545]|uniref:PPOX class F420-dependent oxidoreductase n=1 Tax=Kitasatospora sp. NPDC048545 TaxID=3157208 RepID=UPI0033EDA98D
MTSVIGGDPSSLGPDAGLLAGTWTSLQHVTILLELADTFGFRVDAQLVQELTTVAAMRQHVDRLPSGDGAAGRNNHRETEMTDVLQRLQELLSGPNTAILGTVRPDGRPQQFVVWAAFEDGDVLMSTTKGRPKCRNLEQFPHASLTVYPADNPYASVEVRGTATFGTPDSAEVIERLSQHYKGTSWVEPAGLGERLTVRLTALEAGKD